jgi:hypothetical protein
MNKKKVFHKKKITKHTKKTKKTKNTNKNKNINKNIINVSGSGGGGSIPIPIPVYQTQTQYIPQPIFQPTSLDTIIPKEEPQKNDIVEPKKKSNAGRPKGVPNKPKIFAEPVGGVSTLAKPVDEISSISDKSNSRTRAINQAKLLEGFTNSIRRTPFSDIEDDIPPLVRASDKSSTSKSKPKSTSSSSKSPLTFFNNDTQSLGFNDNQSIVKESDMSSASKSKSKSKSSSSQRQSQIQLTVFNNDTPQIPSEIIIPEQPPKQRKPRSDKGKKRSPYVTRQKTGSIPVTEYFNNRSPQPRMTVQSDNEKQQYVDIRDFFNNRKK